MDVTADIASVKIICKKPPFPSPLLELVQRDGDEKSASPGGTCFTAFVPKSLPMIFPPLEEELEEY